MIFKIQASLHFTDIPHLDDTVVSARNYTVLLGVELDHTNAGLMLTYDGGLVIGEAFAYFCEFDLNKGKHTWRSLEQVMRLRSFFDQSRQKMDF